MHSVLVASIVRLFAIFQLLGGVDNLTSACSAVIACFTTLRHILTEQIEQYVVPWMLGNIEISVAIIGACLPTIVPVLRLLVKGEGPASRGSPFNNVPVLNSLITVGRLSKRKATKIPTGEDTVQGSFERLGQDTWTSSGCHSIHEDQLSTFTDGRKCVGSHIDDEIPLDSIKAPPALRSMA